MVKVKTFTMTFFCFPQFAAATLIFRAKSRGKGLRLVMFHVKQICKI